MAAKSNSSSKSGIKGNKRYTLKTHRLHKIAFPSLWRSKGAL